MRYFYSLLALSLLLATVPTVAFYSTGGNCNEGDKQNCALACSLVRPTGVPKGATLVSSSCSYQYLGKGAKAAMCTCTWNAVAPGGGPFGETLMLAPGAKRRACSGDASGGE